ncbi:hypothetical protein [Marinobacter sp. X15-166B]|uniref:hypothetical protein n=1 Tax=Marinobacter sp. X15-166B TaxID=1897620 RepID=UPI00085C0FA6|nr:hypothetical protein [Marinobacter sp. X15-166B]OEY65261.1 hypothetical protein BG841_01490 [Marinobacter sp. X15-166B]
MKALVIILGVLFIVLLVGIPLLERYSSKSSEAGAGKDYGSLSRFVLPLVALLIIVQMIRYWFG